MSSNSSSKRATAKRRLFEIENNDADEHKQTKNPKQLAVVDDDEVTQSNLSSMIVDSTPQKRKSSNKKQRTTKPAAAAAATTTTTTNEFRPFFSPKGRRFVTPDKDEVEDDDDEKETPIKTNKAKKALPMFEGLTTTRTPLSQKKSNKKIKKTHEKEEEGYVPTYIHKNLSYQRKGKATLTEKSQKTFDFVSQHFNIPKDFETNKFDYGPQSGTCFEERVIQAYNLGLLEPSKEGDSVVEFCSNCIQEGHMKNECPSLI